jgi:hypothetical protein
VEAKWSFVEVEVEKKNHSFAFNSLFRETLFRALSFLLLPPIANHEPPVTT